MSDTCLNCDRPASRQCTLVLESGPPLEGEALCEPCFAFFADTPGIEVHESPVLMRGGEDEEPE